MPNVLLGVTGSVAAIKTPLLFAELRRAGHVVKVVATDPALYFFDPAALDPICDKEADTIPSPPSTGARGEVAINRSQARSRNPEVVIIDADEWPGQNQGQRYQRTDTVLHIELRRWADVLLIAPLDANTLAKLANGLCDNCLTCVSRAWEPTRPVVLAPAMNTLMWQHPATARHLRQLAADAGANPPTDVPFDALPEWINAQARCLRIVPPESRRLACDDVGVGAMADVMRIVEVVGGVAARGAA